jgi:hypothetical protein
MASALVPMTRSSMPPTCPGRPWLTNSVDPSARKQAPIV